MKQTKEYRLLHLIIFIWGTTAILGKEISLDSIQLVWFRLLIAAVFLFVYALLTKKLEKISRREILISLLTGGLIGLHWVAFFASIKLSSVSIGLTMLSSGALFTSLIEPLIFHRKIRYSESLLSLLIVAGIAIIFGVERGYSLAIGIGLFAAAVVSLFTTLNGKFIRAGYPLFALTAYEFLGAFLLVSLLLFGLPLFSDYELPTFIISGRDWFLLAILGIICTDFTVITQNYIMRKISPFTAMLYLNLEPLYGIFFALILYREKEIMSGGFYLGAACILLAIFLESYLKGKTKEVNPPPIILD